MELKIFFFDWGTLRHRVTQGSVLCPLLPIIYVKDLPPRINSVSEPILFGDYTSVIISNRNFEDICSVSNLVLSHMMFAAAELVLNLDKMNIMKYIKKIHHIIHYIFVIKKSIQNRQ